MLTRFRVAIAAVVLLGVLQAVPRLEATTYYIAKNGNDSNSCTQSSPCLTIGRGKNLAGAGDVVQVGAGTYNESLTLTTSGSSTGRITFRGHDGTGCPTVSQPDVNSRGARPAPTVTMNGWNVNANYITIECFREVSDAGLNLSPNVHDIDFNDNWVDATGNLGSPWVGIGFPVIALANMPKNISVQRNYIYGTQYGANVFCGGNCLLQDNEFERMQGGPINTDHDYSRVFGEFITFRHNYMHGNRIADCADPVNRDCHIDCWQTWNINSPGGYELARHVVIDRNTCFNAHEGIIARDTTSSAIGSYSSHYDWVVTNNVIAHGPIGDSMPWVADFDHVGQVVFDNNTVSVGVTGFVNGGQGLSVRNNIFYGAGWSPYSSNISGNGVGQIQLSGKNILYESGRTYSGFGGDIMNTDPRLVNPNSDDWHLTSSSSVAIDAGASNGISVDHDGGIRPAGNGFDIGAYEFGAQTTTTRPNPPTNLQVVVQ